MAAALIRLGVVRRRLAAAGLALVCLSACGGSATEPIDATAYSTVDGVETWDLTGEPSDAAFGIDGDSSAGIYETDEPRAVRVVLPGRTIEVEANLVDFRRGGSGDYTFRASTPQLEPEPLTAELRDVLGQLGMQDASADRFAREVAAAPRDQPEPIEIGVGVGEEATDFGQWSVAPSVTFTPLAGRGRLVLAGAWPSV